MIQIYYESVLRRGQSLLLYNLICDANVFKKPIFINGNIRKKIFKDTKYFHILDLKKDMEFRIYTLRYKYILMFN